MMSSFTRRRIAELHFGPDVQVFRCVQLLLENQVLRVCESEFEVGEKSEGDLDHTAEWKLYLGMFLFNFPPTICITFAHQGLATTTSEIALAASR